MSTDPFGLCADLARRANQEPLDSIFQELIGNRRHGSSKGTIKYLFARYTLKNESGEEIPCFLYGSTQHRTRESIEREHRVFNFTERNSTGEAKLGTRGYGAKLFPFKIAGCYSVWFRIDDSATFSPDEHLWGLRQQVDLNELIECINTNKVLSNNDLLIQYGDRFVVPSTRAQDLNPIKFSRMRDTGLYDFIQANNIQYLQMFRSYNSSINHQLEDALQELAKFYQTNTEVEIYFSEGMKTPRQICVSRGFGLCPSDWISSFTLEWKLGPKHSSGKFWENVFCWTHPTTGQRHFGSITFNGSLDKKFNRRTRSYSLSEKEKWDPDICMRIAVTGEAEANSEYKQFWLFVQEDLISNKTGTLGMDNALRNMGPAQSRLRYIIDILKEGIKDNSETGLVIEGVKRKSTIQQKLAIYEMIQETLKLGKKYLSAVEEIDGALLDRNAFLNDDVLAKIPKFIETDKIHTEKSRQRKKEGIKFEAVVKNYVQEELEELDSNEIVWETNDSEISVAHDLGDFQGIDLLGSVVLRGRNFRFAAQMKNKKSALSQAELQNFVQTVDALKKRYEQDTVYAYLVVANEKCLGGAIIRQLQPYDISIVIEEDELVGGNLTHKIMHDISLIYPDIQ